MNNFKESVNYINTNYKDIGHTDLLELYGLYKQATEGDNDTECPTFFNMKARKKWEAWDERKGLTKDTAKKWYCSCVNRLRK